MKTEQFINHPNYLETKESMPLHLKYWIYYDLMLEKEKGEKSIIHNASSYALTPFYKPISKIINLNEDSE